HLVVALRYGVVGGILIALIGLALGQDKDKPPAKDADKPPPRAGQAQPPPRRSLDEYRQFFKTPETPHEFWQALKFELDLGATDLALRHLRGFLDKKPTDADLLQIE